MPEPQTISVSQKARLNNLLGSWLLRARANVKGEGTILRDNAAALEAAMATADMASRFRDGWREERERNEKRALIVDEVVADLREFARFRGPRPKRSDMDRLATRLQEALEAL